MFKCGKILIFVKNYNMVNSLLDLDFYKLTMMEYAFHYYRDVVVDYRMVNRSRRKYRVLDHVPINVIVSEIEKCRNLTFSSDEISYLRGLDRFSGAFLDFLSNYRLGDGLMDLKFEVVDGDVSVYTRGRWVDTILWETIVLSTINELYYIHKYNYNYDEVLSIAMDRLHVKMVKMEEYPALSYMEFGTRRRFSYQLQHDLLSNHGRFNGTLLGTSNVKLAMDLGLKPLGTNAHELYMIMSGIYSLNDDTIRNSHSLTLSKWYELYGNDLSIALSDTFGTDFFLTDFIKFAKDYKGVRQDSGSPYEFAEKFINFYNENNINAKDKMIVFSDGLNVEKMIDLYTKFIDRIGVSFGWGTNFSNDVGYETLSLVMKAVRVYSIGDTIIDFELVKLSDNINKATGTPESIERYKRVFSYTNTKSEDLIY